MYANTLLVANFDRLTAPLMMAGSDLTRSLTVLEKTVRLAVPSLLGWSLTVKVDGRNVTLTSISPWAKADDIRASLRVPLSAFMTAGLEGDMTFYAEAAHAFFRVASDFVPVLGPAICLLRTDQDLNPNLSSNLSGVREMSRITRAIGVLVAAGNTLEAARDRLQASARSAQLTLDQSAGVFLTQHDRAVLHPQVA
jgi:hypothetical protein